MPEDFDQPALSGDPDLEALLDANAHAGLCPPPDLLFAAEEDVLPVAAGAAIREHSAHCLLCQTLLEGLAPAESALTPGQKARIRGRVEAEIEASAPAHSITMPAARRQSLWDFAPIAAILILALGSFLVFRWVHRPVDSENAEKTPVKMTAPSSPAPVPVEIAELKSIAPLLPPNDALLTTRGGGGASPSTADLLPAFRAYNRGDFAAAAAAFAPVAARFPKADVPALYLGVSQLELNDNAAALTTLAHAQNIATPARHGAIAWYLAIAKLRSGDTQAAASLLQSVCGDTQSAYSARACTIAGQIAK